MVRFASLFNVVERTVTFLSGKRYSLDTLRSLGAGELLNSMCEFSEKLAALRLDADEMSLFTAVVLVSAGENSSPVTQRAHWEGGSPVNVALLVSVTSAIVTVRTMTSSITAAAPIHSV